MPRHPAGVDSALDNYGRRVRRRGRNGSGKISLQPGSTTFSIPDVQFGRSALEPADRLLKTGCCRSDWAAECQLPRKADVRAALVTALSTVRRLRTFALETALCGHRTGCHHWPHRQPGLHCRPGSFAQYRFRGLAPRRHGLVHRQVPAASDRNLHPHQTAHGQRRTLGVRCLRRGCRYS